MEKHLEILDKYADAFRALINNRVWDGEESPTKLLRLNDENDWSFICVAMDVVGDASLALDNFIRFSLNGPTRYDETGEKYLRLYGVLSAAYIQQEAIIKLYALMNCPDPKTIKAEFNALDIRTLRHQLSSHSLDYVETRNDKPRAFVPIRMELNKFTCTVTENRGDESRTYKLDTAIVNHCKITITVLDKIYEKSIKTLYKGQQKKLDKYSKKLEDLRFERDGNIIIKFNNGENDGEYRIIYT